LARAAGLRIALAGTALALLLGATLSPLAELGGERLFSAHMIQHLLLGDIAPLLVALALGARAAVLHPLAALLAWCGALALWHVPRLYDEALRTEWVHQLQHLSFFLAGLALWGAIVGERALLAWRIGAVVGMGLAGLVLGNLFLWAGHVIYTPYSSAPRAWGLSPLADQQLGGAIMLAEGAAVTIGVLAWLLLRALQEPEGAQPAV
jgi:cytochrome c oxidase assembly factor CtaG